MALLQDRPDFTQRLRPAPYNADAANPRLQGNEPAKAGFSLLQKGIDKAVELLSEILKDIRTKQDLKSLLPTLRAIIDRNGGAAIARYMGVNPDGAGHSLYEYLGIQILGPAISEDDARDKYTERAKSPKTEFGQVCRIGDTKDDGPQLRAAAPETSLSRTLSDNLLRYYNKNPGNMKLDGDIITRSYVEREIIFVDLAGLKEIAK